MPLLRLARRRGVPVVVNQDGVAYPGWAGARTDELNGPLRRALLAADHVLYQSRFSKESSDRFLGEPRGSWEVLHNAVDIERFTPPPSPAGEGLVLLLGGDQTQAYRLESALRTLALLPEARLIVTGRLVSDPRAVGRASSESATASSSSVATHRATRRISFAGRICCFTRRSRTRARAL